MNDVYEDEENDVDLHDNNVGDLEAYNVQENMDQSIPYSRCYAFDSDDDGPDEEVDEDGFTSKEVEAFKKVLGKDPRTPMFEDVTLADEAVVDGGKTIVLGARPISHRDMDHATNGIAPGTKFGTFLELKVWIKEFSVKHFRPYTVIHSDIKKRYTVKCVEDRCPWIVRARPFNGGPTCHIVSCVQTHMCCGKKVDGKDANPDHMQLTSEFIAYRLSNSISSLPTTPIKSIIDIVKTAFHYTVKYGKAWKAKQAHSRCCMVIGRKHTTESLDCWERWLSLTRHGSCG